MAHPMRTRRHISLSLTAFFAVAASAAWACPFCKVAGGELGNDLAAGMSAGISAATSAATGPADSSPVRIGFAADLTSAYFRHGYMQQDRGVIFQPTLSLSLRQFEWNGWAVDPYFVWFNSIHGKDSPGYAGGHGSHTRVERQYQQYLDGPHDGAPFPHYHYRLVDVLAFEDAGGGWFETELKPGVVFTRGPLIVDLNLMGSIYPNNFHDTMIELGIRVSYDLASLWDRRENRDEPAAFSLRLNNAIAIELRDDNGDEETVIETSIEPTWRFRVGDYQTALTLPVGVGWSLDGFYQDTDTDNETFGYVSLGIKSSTRLPTDPKHGNWFVNVGVTWYHFLADSAIFANGDKDGFSATVGIGIAF